MPATCFMALICAEPPTRDTEKAHVDGRAIPALKRLAPHLTVGDGDHVGGDVRETSPACVSMMGRAVMEPAPQTVVHLAAFEEASGGRKRRRVGFTSRRTTEQQGHLAIQASPFGQVVVHDEGVLAAVAVIFGHGATGVGRDILQGRLSGSRNDGGVLHGTMLAQGVGHERDSGAFLPDSHIEAVHVGILLGKDVDADGGLAGLTVAVTSSRVRGRWGSWRRWP